MKPVARSAAGASLDEARRLLLEQVADGAGLVDVRAGEFRVLDCNPALRRLGGSPSGALDGRRWVEAFPALSALVDAFAEVLRSGRAVEAVDTPPGTERAGASDTSGSGALPAWWRCVPLFDGSGRLGQLLVVARPAALAVSSVLDRIDAERLPLPLAVIEGPERTLALVNEPFARLTGQPAKDLTGRPLSAFRTEAPPVGILARLEEITRAGVTGALVECSVRLAGGDADEEWTLAILPVPAIGAATARILVLAFDAAVPGREREHARQSAVAALWRAGQLEAVFGAMVDGVLVLDQTGMVVEANEAALSILGLTANTESRQLVDYLAPLMPRGADGRAADIGADLLAGVLTGRVLPDVQLTLLARNGEESVISLRGAPVRDAQSTIVGAVVVLRDVTDQRRINQEKDAFLSVISHEVKSPLTSIKGFAQLAARAALGPQGERLRGHLRVIEQQVSRIERLIDELADVDRASEAALREEPVVFDLASHARLVLEQQQVTVAGHRLVFVGGEERLPILADPARIEQVLTNLITNATKYSPEAGEVTVGVERAGTAVHLWVRDEGIGIPRTELGRLFDRFYRASNARRRGYGGLGLGLYVVHEIVQRSRGQIWVESEEGRGTTFHITLPLHEQRRR